MKVAAVLPFRAGRAAAKAIEPDALAFYELITPCVFGPSYALERRQARETIPLYSEMNVNPDLIRLAAMRVARTWNDVDAVIVDLTSTATYSLPNHHVIAGILGFIDSDRARNQRIYVLLIPMMFAAEDVATKTLQPFVDNGIVGLVADNGDHLGLSDVFSEFDAGKYAQALTAARKSPLSVLRKKLIRFPGHFLRHTGAIHTHCVEFFFDGRLFERELVDLLAHRAVSLFREWPSCEVYYDAPVSPWLESAVLGLKERLEIRVGNLEELPEPANHKFIGPIWIIVPLSDTGETIRKIVQYIRHQGYAGEIAILAVLSTVGEAPEDGKFQLSVAGEQFSVSYLLKVEQIRINRGECVLCASNTAQGDPLDPDPYLSISTQAFWKLVLELGFVEEQNVPDYRESLGPVPRFERIGEASSAYLAYKIDNLLKSLPEGRPPEVTIVCPNEGGAAAIADCLDSTFNMTVIKVPKGVLRRVREGNTDKLPEELAAQYAGPLSPEWLMQLQSLKTIQQDLRSVQLAFSNGHGRIVVMDEMNVTGNTRDDLIGLVKAFDLEILCCLSMIDFAKPAIRSNGQALSLYRISRTVTERHSMSGVS